MAEKLLTVREVQTAGDGDHSDGAGLMLRVRGVSGKLGIAVHSAKWASARDGTRRGAKGQLERDRRQPRGTWPPRPGSSCSPA